MNSDGITELNGSRRRRRVFFLNGRSHHAQVTSLDRVIHCLRESITKLLIFPKISDFSGDWLRNDLGLFRQMQYLEFFVRTQIFHVER